MIGNDLHRRKFEVVFVSPKSSPPASESSPHHASAPAAEYEETWLRIDLEQNPHREIEEDIVAELVRRHGRWIDGGARTVA